MEDDKYRKKHSAAQKMQILKLQQATLETRAMPEHLQLKLKEHDKKTKSKRKKKLMKRKSRKVKQKLDAADSSSSSKSRVSTGGSSAALPPSSSHTSDVQHSKLKDEEENIQKWKHRTKYIYEAERISIKLKQIADEYEKYLELRATMDDITTRIDVLKRARDEYYQYVQAQNDIFDEQIKLLDELQTTQLSELINQVDRLNETFENTDAKLAIIKEKLRNITDRQKQKTLIQYITETIHAAF